MSREQLLGVVRSLNEKLPRSMRIGAEEEELEGDADDYMEESILPLSDAQLRRRIEELVGIRKAGGSSVALARVVPPAPKAVRTRDMEWRVEERPPWEIVVDDEEGDADTRGTLLGGAEHGVIASSPLSMRARTYSHLRGRRVTLTRLSALQEENEQGGQGEDEEEGAGRAAKRRRVSAESQETEITPSFIASRNQSRRVPTAQGSHLLEDLEASASILLEFDSESTTKPTTITGSEVETCRRETAITDAHLPCPIVCDQPTGNNHRRKRSARIQQNVLKRAATVHTGGQVVGAAHKHPSFSRTRTKSCMSYRPRAKAREAVQDDDSTIRRSLTSTSAQAKPVSMSTSTPRILRSHTQRGGVTHGIGPGSQLARSQSERLPRSLDTRFVTTERPRYRLCRRNTKRNRAVDDVEEDEGEGKDKDEDEEEQGITCFNSGLSSALSFLTPRSRALSASTVASRWTDDNAEPVLQEARASVLADIDFGPGIAEGIWMALEKMDVETT